MLSKKRKKTDTLYKMWKVLRNKPTSMIKGGDNMYDCCISHLLIAYMSTSQKGSKFHIWIPGGTIFP